ATPGRGLMRTALIRLKIAVFAPIPSASVSTATAVKPGFFSSWRKANLRSFIRQFRNPRAEIRKKSEVRMSNASHAERSLRFSGFGFRISFGLRISGFGLLLVSQRLHWIDSCRAARGQPAGQQSGGRQQHDD